MGEPPEYLRRVRAGRLHRPDRTEVKYLGGGEAPQVPVLTVSSSGFDGFIVEREALGQPV